MTCIHRHCTLLPCRPSWHRFRSGFLIYSWYSRKLLPDSRLKTQGPEHFMDSVLSLPFDREISRIFTYHIYPIFTSPHAPSQILLQQQRVGFVFIRCPENSLYPPQNFKQDALSTTHPHPQFPLIIPPDRRTSQKIILDYYRQRAFSLPFTPPVVSQHGILRIKTVRQIIS